MKLKALIPLFALAGLTLTPPALAEPAARPNVLMIAIDDLNDWVGCLGGHPQVKTPCIDALAARGTLFTNAHIQSPLCNPCRASLMTGLRPSTTGIYGLRPGIRDVEATRDAVTLPQSLMAAGYFTFTCGKIYHGGSIPPRLRSKEFHVWGPSYGIPRPKKKLVDTPAKMSAMDWGVFPEKDQQQGDWKIADAAIAQLESLPEDKPFFVACGFHLPHVPCFATQKWFDLYPEETLVLPRVKENDRADVPEFAWYLHWKLPEPRLSWVKQAGQWKNLVRSYLACTSFVDSQVGRVLEGLEASGRADDTIVVLWSDHGWHLGEKAITGKNTLWHESTRVPLVFAGPGVSKGARCNRPAELLDIYPTLVELCDLPANDRLEGHSLVPQLKDAGAPRPWPAITTHNPGNHSVCSEHWRYIRYADGSEELYDLRADPHEWTNLAQSEDPKHAQVIREHARFLPEKSAPHAPGSAARILQKRGDTWYWEGEPIVPSELEK